MKRNETPEEREARLAAARKRREHLVATTAPLGYTVLEVGAAYRLSRTKVYSLIKAGDLEIIKIGKSTRVTPESAARLGAAS